MRASLVGVAALTAILAYCYRQSKTAQAARGQVKEDLRRWEGEGGNVPAVATPSPVTSTAESTDNTVPPAQTTYPGAESQSRH